MQTITARENIRIDRTDVIAGDVIARIDSDIPLATLATMIQLGQATASAGVQPLGARPDPTEPPPTEPPQLTNHSALGSFGIPDKLVDLMAAHDPPILTKTDVIAYLDLNKDLTPITGIGKTSSDRIIAALGL